MTPEELRTNIWANRVSQKEAEIVALLVDLNIAQQRIRALEEAAKPKTADVIPLKKEGEDGIQPRQ